MASGFEHAAIMQPGSPSRRPSFPMPASRSPNVLPVTDRLKDLLDALPPPLAVVVAAMLPVLELRGAIPFGRVLGMNAVPAYAWAVIGNLIPIPFILWWLGPVTTWAEERWPALHRFLERLFASTRRRHTARFDRLRDLALITFVAIPLPITGGWSGALAAFVFGVERKRAFALIAVGVLIAGVIVSLITSGVVAVI